MLTFSRIVIITMKLLTCVLMTRSSPVSLITTRQLYSPSMASLMLRIIRPPVSLSRMMSPPPLTLSPPLLHSALTPASPLTHGSTSSEPSFTLYSSSSRGSLTTDTRIVFFVSPIEFCQNNKL